ncbi:hypothetical protein JOM56_009822 [Amanita muscaria]
MSDFQSNRAFTPSNTHSCGPFLRFVFVPQYAMGEEETRTLWCLVHGDPDPFEVTVVLGSVNIISLKEAIWFKRKNDLHDVDASRLVLWKMNGLELLEPEASLAYRIESRGDIATFATKLTSSQEVSTLFPKRPLIKNRVHIIVELPSTTSRKRPYWSSAEDEDREAKRKHTALHSATLPSEHSLHKLWALARNLGETLFETRPVQRDESPTKTELPSNCMVLNGGDWIKNLLPVSRFTDVLIRDEYNKALRAVIDWCLNRKRVTTDMQPAPWRNLFLDVPAGHVSKQSAFVLLGNPGIGKTVFLYVLLVLRLHARLPTIFQSEKTHVYYFDDKGVFDMTPEFITTHFRFKFDQSTWCLIDSNPNLSTVPVFIQNLGLFIVQAASPRPHRFEWTKKAVAPVTRYFMEPWTLSELLVGRVLQVTPCSEAHIKYFSNLYGTSARSVYTNAEDPSDYLANLQDQLTSITYEKVDNLVKQSSALDLSDPISHQIVSISPGLSRNLFEASIPTRHIYEQLRNSLPDKRLEVIARLYEIYVRVPKTRSNAGYILEDAVSDVFPLGGEWCLVSMVRSKHKGPKCTHWKTPADSTATQYLHLGHLGRHIAIDINKNPDKTKYNRLETILFLSLSTSLTLKDGFYLPSSPSQATFDGFIYESASKTATVFQVTTSKKHSVSEEGIKWLQGLGVKKFRYIAVTTPDTPFDLPFPNEWSARSELIPEKYILAVESLPKYAG